MAAEIPSLAAVLTRLKRQQRLSYAHIARIGRLSRNTVKQIADGKTTRPSEDTLCKIAIGLAVDPYTGQINQDTLAMSLNDLGEAAGYDDLADHWIRQTLPVLLTTLVGNLDTATAWVRLIAEHPDLDPERLREIVDDLDDGRPSE